MARGSPCPPLGEISPGEKAVAKNVATAALAPWLANAQPANITFSKSELTIESGGKSLHFNKAQLANDKGTALSGRELTIGQNMLCREFIAHGRIDLAGARISGRLSLTDATLKNPPDVALTARGATMARLAMPTA